MDQSAAPLFDALTRHVNSQSLSFHVPGHKGGTAAAQELLRAWGDRFLSYDLTELDHLDDLHAPGGVIAEAEALAAEAFGAAHTFFLTAGATAGIIAGILATTLPEDKVIVPRNVHRSVIGGLALAGATPVFLHPVLDELTGAGLGLETEQLEAGLQSHPDVRLVVLVHPTYYGACGPIVALIRCAHDHGVPVLVDEAHGSHLTFAPCFPCSALGAGADIVIHGTHKTLGALTGGAMMHLRARMAVTPERVRAALRLVHTTSPSYPVLASLDVARRQAAGRTADDWQRMAAYAGEVKEYLAADDLLYVHPGRLPRPGYWEHDPLKLVVATSGHVRGDELAAGLAERGIHAEIAGERNVLLVLGALNRLDARVLCRELSELASDLRGVKGPSPLPPPRGALSVMPLQEALRSRQRLLPLADAAGQVAGEVIAVYPPGTVAVCPGEALSSEVVGYLMSLVTSGKRVHGVGAGPDYPVLVVEKCEGG